MGKTLGNIGGLEKIHPKLGQELVQALLRLEKVIQAIKDTGGNSSSTTTVSRTVDGLAIPIVLNPGPIPEEVLVLDQERTGAGINNSHMIRVRVAASDGTPHWADFRLRAKTLVNDAQGSIFVIEGRRDNGGYKNLLKIALPNGPEGANIELGSLDDNVQGILKIIFDADNYATFTPDASGNLLVDQTTPSGAPQFQVARQILAVRGMHANAHPITNVLDPTDPQDADTLAARDAAIAALGTAPFLPAFQWSGTGNPANVTSAGGGNPILDDTQFKAPTYGGTAYTIGDMLDAIIGSGILAP